MQTGLIPAIVPAAPWQAHSVVCAKIYHSIAIIRCGGVDCTAQYARTAVYHFVRLIPRRSKRLCCVSVENDWELQRGEHMVALAVDATNASCKPYYDTELSSLYGSLPAVLSWNVRRDTSCVRMRTCELNLVLRVVCLPDVISGCYSVMSMVRPASAAPPKNQTRQHALTSHVRSRQSSRRSSIRTRRHPASGRGPGGPAQ